ncbi:MAG: TrkA family potassium uptake protein [Candidatus Omnitrophica bacterium]|nr:TrkA family potassium uptake protein [Candidatus Omnitrophota bacterium]
MKQFAVIGLGRFGASVAATLAAKGQQVIAIDSNEDNVNDIVDLVSKAVCLDATDEKAMKAIGVQNVDAAICGIGTHIEASILITLLLKDLGVPVVICKAVNTAHKKALERIGATKVILPERDMGIRLANTLLSVSDTVIDHIGIADSASIIELIAPDEFVGKTLRDLDVRAQYGVNVIAVKKQPEEGEEDVPGSRKINASPMADYVVEKDDVLVLFGENDKIEEMKKKTE